jgi:hypothetical protein
MQVKEYKKNQKLPIDKEKTAELIKKARKDHERLVKGKFEFTDANGGWIDFCYRFFPGDPIMTIHLNHGEICELPMGIVKHLNNTVKKVRKLDMTNLDTLKRGVPQSYDVESRVKFTPVDFL